MLPADYVKDRETCLEKNYKWVNEAVNFDNVFKAYFSLLEIASFKGWIQLIYGAMDSRVSTSSDIYAEYCGIR